MIMSPLVSALVVGYTEVLALSCRAGSLDVVKAQELGVPPGRAYASLKEGEAVLAEGQSCLVITLTCVPVMSCIIGLWLVLTHNECVGNVAQLQTLCLSGFHICWVSCC